MMGNWFYGGGWWGWIMMFFMMIIPVLVISAFLYLGYRAVTRSEGGRTPDFRPSPTDIVQARYARGEITRDEYLEIRKDLTETS